MGLRTGSQYLQDLRDGRQVWLDGKRVEDVTTHPRLAPFAQAMAAIFDLQHDPANRDLLTMPSPITGDRVSLAYHPPRSVDDLRRQREMLELLQRLHGGVLGRCPQYTTLVLLGLYNQRARIDQLNPEFAGNVARYVDYCREHDSCLTFGFTDPPRDRRLPSTTTEYLKIVDRSSKGIVIRGLKAVATLGPYADEYFGLTATRPDLAPDEVLYFGLPVATEGLRIVCRESFARARQADHPLSAGYDEMDAWVLFDDVFVPNERIFMIGHPEVNEEIFRPSTTSWGHALGLVRIAIKTEVLAGICFAITDYLGTRDLPHTQTLLAEVVTHLETLRTFVRAAEEDPVYSEEGLAMPNPQQVSLGRVHSLKEHARILEIVRELCGSGILMSPGEPDLQSEDVGEAMRRYMIGGDQRAPDRFKMMKLAWEYTSESFGMRQLLFEMHNAGSLATNQARLMKGYDPSALEVLAKQIAGIDR